MVTVANTSKIRNYELWCIISNHCGCQLHNDFFFNSHRFWFKKNKNKTTKFPHFISLTPYIMSQSARLHESNPLDIELEFNSKLIINDELYETFLILSLRVNLVVNIKRLIQWAPMGSLSNYIAVKMYPVERTITWPSRDNRGTPTLYIMNEVFNNYFSAILSVQTQAIGLKIT